MKDREEILAKAISEYIRCIEIFKVDILYDRYDTDEIVKKEFKKIVDMTNNLYKLLCEE